MLLRASARRAGAAASRRQLTVAVTGRLTSAPTSPKNTKRGPTCAPSSAAARRIRRRPRTCARYGAERLTLVDGGDLSIQGSFGGTGGSTPSSTPPLPSSSAATRPSSAAAVENVTPLPPVQNLRPDLVHRRGHFLDKPSLTFDEDDWNDFSNLDSDAYGLEDPAGASERSLPEHQLRRAPPGTSSGP